MDNCSKNVGLMQELSGFLLDVVVPVAKYVITCYNQREETLRSEGCKESERIFKTIAEGEVRSVRGMKRG